MNSGHNGNRRIVLLAYPRLVLLDMVGPSEVFAMANWIARTTRTGVGEPYVIETVSGNGDLRFQASSGITLLADRSWRDCLGDIDTLLVPGGVDPERIVRDTALAEWLRSKASTVRRIGSICTGAFILAAAGLLDGRRATTHWQDCDRLACGYPDIRVESDRIYVKDGNVYTSAGVTAGMDMALALVEEDLGREFALEVARTLVMYVRRSGGLSQFSVLLQSQAAERQPLRDLMVWAAENPRENLSVNSLASRVNMSVRNFSRTFRREMGQTPARYVESLRVEAARRLIEDTDIRLDQVARECGLGSGNSMRRSFLRVSGIAPSDYRQRVRRAP